MADGCCVGQPFGTTHRGGATLGGHLEHNMLLCSFKMLSYAYHHLVSVPKRQTPWIIILIMMLPQGEVLPGAFSYLVSLGGSRAGA